MRTLLLALVLLSPLPLLAQEAPPKPGIRETSPGIYELGDIKLNKETKTVTFPGAVNMDKGSLEYLLVGKSGPTHESLLVTEISAIDLHTVMLLLGAKGSKPAAPGAAVVPGQITAEYLKTAPKLTGDSLTLTVTWKDKSGAEKTGEVADWLYFLPTKKAPARGPWLYTGSTFGADNKFVAEQQDIFGSLVINPVALINNPRKGNDDDRLWEVNDKVVPPAQTPITISIKLTPASAK